MARDIFADLASIREELLGRDNPSTIQARHNHAVFAADAGDPAYARPLLLELVTDTTRVLGPLHRETLRCRYELIECLNELELRPQAEQLLVELLADFDRANALGPDHPDTLIARGTLARWREEAGDFPSALAIWSEVIRGTEATFGKRHPQKPGRSPRVRERRHGS